jgi:hypothetical protein
MSAAMALSVKGRQPSGAGADAGAGAGTSEGVEAAAGSVSGLLSLVGGVFWGFTRPISAVQSIRKIQRKERVCIVIQAIWFFRIQPAY